jgi:SAM-dependent methyltransferase
MFTRHDWEGSPLCDQVYGPRYVARSSLIRRVLGKTGHDNALDIGCGSGNITRHVADFAAHVHAIDVSPSAVEVARANVASYSNITLEATDIFGPKAKRQHQGKYDLVVLSEVLEHLDEDERALETIATLLVPGGHLLLTVPADPRQWSVEDELAGHKRRYTREELTGKLNSAGFQVEQLVNWGFPFTRVLLGVERRLMRVRPSGGAGGSGLRPLLSAARLFFKLNGIVEPAFSHLDRGIGYVVLARNANPAATIRAA